MTENQTFGTYPSADNFRWIGWLEPAIRFNFTIVILKVQLVILAYKFLPSEYNLFCKVFRESYYRAAEEIDANVQFCRLLVSVP